eukprot:1194065-Prorocentrum_minimum.AAC.2
MARRRAVSCTHARQRHGCALPAVRTCANGTAPRCQLYVHAPTARRRDASCTHVHQWHVGALPAVWYVCQWHGAAQHAGGDAHMD